VSAFSWPVRITDDDDSVDARLHDGTVVPERCTEGDLLWTVEWLATYDCADDTETAQMIANVIGFLSRKADEMARREAVTVAKRAYAAEHGVPVSSVRVRKKTAA
jgi:hypothetical protein